MPMLYDIHTQRGHVTFKVFKHWISANNACCWIDAQILFKRTSSELSDIKIIYSFLVIKNAMHFHQLNEIQSMGCHIIVIYNDERHQNISLSIQKNPEYAKKDYWIFEDAEKRKKTPSNNIIWNGLAKFKYNCYDSFCKSASSKTSKVAVNKIVKLSKIILSAYLGKTPKIFGILDAIENWVWFFDWTPAKSNCLKTEVKVLKNNQSDYVWLIAKYRSTADKTGCSCCGCWVLNRLEINIDCYQFKPINQFAMQIVDKLEQLTSEQEISEILRRMINQRATPETPIAAKRKNKPENVTRLAWFSRSRQSHDTASLC